jgi:hypothetical protein
VFRRAESDLRRSHPPGQGIDRNVSGKSDVVVASPDTAPSLARMDNSEVGNFFHSYFFACIWTVFLYIELWSHMLSSIQGPGTSICIA